MPKKDQIDHDKALKIGIAELKRRAQLAASKQKEQETISEQKIQHKEACAKIKELKSKLKPERGFCISDDALGALSGYLRNTHNLFLPSEPPADLNNWIILIDNCTESYYLEHLNKEAALADLANEYTTAYDCGDSYDNIYLIHNYEFIDWVAKTRAKFTIVLREK
jgi:hypothetical protein